MNSNKKIIKQKCYVCGHDRFIKNGEKNKCARCGSVPTKLETYKNKHKKERTKVIEQ